MTSNCSGTNLNGMVSAENPTAANTYGRKTAAHPTSMMREEMRLRVRTFLFHLLPASGAVG